MIVHDHGSLAGALLEVSRQISDLYGPDAAVVDDLEFTALRVPGHDGAMAFFVAPKGESPTIISAYCSTC